MNDLLAILKRVDLKEFAGPVLIILILSMMILPLPPFLLDLLFTFSIALSLVILLVSLYTVKALEFAAFPTILLMATLLRLSLNVASTRVVLLHGHTGPDAAGHVIEAFGSFVVGGNYAVGLVVFIILVIINFVVITKGAGRIAEVGARFTLDAMPGKQMAIDADLNAGLIGEDEARRRRAEVAQEADFYGAMDGASKFVRGDAIAGILIMLINVIGGFIIGVLQHGLPVAEAAQNYTLLTIGDGLVAQIPAIIISTAAGIVVSRVATEQHLSQQIVGQLFAKPEVIALTAGIIGLLGLVPGMPHFAFLTLALAGGTAAWYMAQRQRQAVAAVAEAPPETASAAEPVEVGWDDIVPVDPLGLEVGYRLIPMVDRGQNGELLHRIKAVRKKFAQELGFLVPPVHIRDNLELRPGGYRLTLKGVGIAEGEVFPDLLLAINPGQVIGELPGTATRDPAFGLPALWINQENKNNGQALGYTVVDPATVVATHLSQLIQEHAHELLGREEVQQLLDHLAKSSPKLVEDLVPKLLPLGTVQKVLQNLLEEGIHIRDLRSIVETLADHAPRSQDPDTLTAAVRVALGRSIVQQLFSGMAELQVMALDPDLEHILLNSLQANGEGSALEPGLAERMLTQTTQAVEYFEKMGMTPVLVVPAPIRTILSRFLRRAASQLRVLSYAEVPESKTVKVVTTLGGRA
ncbi:flagellar biosynthesis protein FlhA [Thermithiobacillus tepidarius DSM 3134]|uniref:flagellar biosynthesis protein FlhA n=1 Tax=Thermithiobacillus tepidarius TaxID=929 RepID=UPI0003F7876D